MFSDDDQRAQRRDAVSNARATFREVLGNTVADNLDRRLTVGKHEAKNYAHLRAVIAEADATCPRAADTIRWLLWHNVLEAQRMASFADAQSDTGKD